MYKKSPQTSNEKKALCRAARSEAPPRETMAAPRRSELSRRLVTAGLRHMEMFAFGLGIKIALGEY